MSYLLYSRVYLRGIANLTYDDAINWIKRDPSKFHDLPNSMKNSELLLIAVEQNDGWGVLSRGKLVRSLQTPEIALAAVKQNGYALKYIGYEYRSQEVSEIAVHNYPASYMYVPLPYQTYELTLYAVKNRIETLVAIPDKYKDKEMLLAAIYAIAVSGAEITKQYIIVKYHPYFLVYFSKINRDEMIKFANDAFELFPTTVGLVRKNEIKKYFDVVLKELFK